MPEISRRSVLTVLGAGALAAGTAATVHAATAGSALPVDTAEGSADNPIRVENRLPGSADWRIGAGDTVGADDLGRQIAGYTSATSVNLGGSLDFHVLDVTRAQLHDPRDLPARLLRRRRGAAGHRQPRRSPG